MHRHRICEPHNPNRSFSRILVNCVAIIAIANVALLDASPARAGETITYSYDALGRLRITSHSGTVNDGKQATVAYDPAGNRTSYVAADAPAGAANLSIGNASVTEGGALVFTVTRSNNISSMVSVNYATASGTATSGSDFNSISGTLVFGGSEVTKTVCVPTVDDFSIEATENLTMTLSGASSGATITGATGTGSIVDNDVAWSSSMTSGSYQNCYWDDFSDSYVCDPMSYGYIPWGGAGSMANTSWHGQTISAVYSYNSVQVNFVMTGSSAPPNSGWNSMTIPGVGTLNRASATYYAVGNQATWSWSNSANVASGTLVIQ